MIDLSHGNSKKDHKKQKLVAQSVAEQLQSSSHPILGVMIESNLVSGKQGLQANSPLTYGQSITDACVDWNESLDILNLLANAVNET
mgnify:CR=1 FL=1